MAACRASQAGGVARVSSGRHAEYVIVLRVVVVGGAVILISNENDGEIGVGTNGAGVCLVDTGLGDEGHAGRLQLVLFATALGTHGRGKAREDVCKLEIVGCGVVPYAPSGGGILDIFDPTLTNIEATTSGDQRVVRICRVGTAVRNRSGHIVGIVAPQEAPVAQPIAAVAAHGAIAGSHVAADHANVQVRQATGKRLQSRDHCGEVRSQGSLLGVHRRRVVDHEQDVDRADCAHQHREIGLLPSMWPWPIWRF